MPDLDDLRSDLKSERIQLDTEPFHKELEDLEKLFRAVEPSAPADVSRTLTATSPRAAVALAAYLAQVADDLGHEPDIHIQGSQVTVQAAAAPEEAAGEADLDPPATFSFGT